MLTKGSLGEKEFVWLSVSDHSPSFQERQGKDPSSQSQRIRSIRSQEQRENEPILAPSLSAGLLLSDTIQGPLLKEWTSPTGLCLPTSINSRDTPHRQAHGPN